MDLDGYCSAAIIKKRYPEAELIGFHYGDSFQELLDLIPPDCEVIMADVSLPMDQMAELADHVSGQLTWIDHHASAIKDYQEYMAKHFANSMSEVGFLDAVLEDGISACEGTWKYFFPNKPIPRAVEILGQYDTWRNQDKMAWDHTIIPFQFGMRLNTISPETFPMNLLEPDVHVDDIVEMIRRGNVILKYQRQQNEFSMKKSFVIDFDGYRALACNSGGNSETFASVWDESKHDLMMGFKFIGDKWVFTMYTTKDIDLGALAKKYGGGGHLKAAGFQLDTIPEFIFGKAELVQSVKNLIEELNSDADYRRTWADNISMAFQDTFNKEVTDRLIEPTTLKKIADQAANSFLGILCM